MDILAAHAFILVARLVTEARVERAARAGVARQFSSICPPPPPPPFLVLCASIARKRSPQQQKHGETCQGNADHNARSKKGGGGGQRNRRRRGHRHRQVRDAQAPWRAPHGGDVRGALLQCKKLKRGKVRRHGKRRSRGEWHASGGAAQSAPERVSQQHCRNRRQAIAHRLQPAGPGGVPCRCTARGICCRNGVCGKQRLRCRSKGGDIQKGKRHAHRYVCNECCAQVTQVAATAVGRGIRPKHNGRQSPACTRGAREKDRPRCNTRSYRKPIPQLHTQQ